MKAKKPNRAVLISLRNPTRHELNGAFAHHIANLRRVGLEWGSGPEYWHHIGPAIDPKDNLMDTVPNYCGDFRLLTPWLKPRGVVIEKPRHGEWTVRILRNDRSGTNKSLPRAAVIALLRDASIGIS